MKKVVAGFVASLLALPVMANQKQLLWGDTHVHTYYSPDSYINQNFSVGPATAYQFARGLPVIHPTTHTRVQIQTPLDFLVISDHAESMGVFLAAHSKAIPRDDLGLWDRMKAWLVEHAFAYLVGDPDNISLFLKYATASTTDVIEAAKTPASLPIPNAARIQRQSWLESIAAADAANDPGNFTALIGWEWSAIPAGSNLHRVVFTNGDASHAEQFIPFSSSVSNYPEDLWQWLDKTSAETGADFIAIPHNANISRGFMFPAEKRLRDTAIDPQWIAQRARWETVVEVTQVKGDSETAPALSPNDPFAAFEPFPYYLKPGVADYQAFEGDFIRSALRTGLTIEQQFGANPYRFGVIGSTDSHTGLATAEEPNFWGKMATDSTPQSKSRDSGHIEKLGWAMSASGLAAVWAEDNSRESIFAAFKRREVYATTGSRIAVQVYASSEFRPGDELRMDPATARAQGVAMGGEISGPTAPAFFIHAAKDPNSAHLDRVQMVKGWVDGKQSFEQIYDVVWAGKRKPDANGLVPAVIDTVDAATGLYSNDQGEAILSAVWVDPDFNAAQSAFYYVRVLELPTPRHSTLDAIALNVDPLQTEAMTGQPVSIQERAYTSPIWYTPE